MKSQGRPGAIAGKAKGRGYRVPKTSRQWVEHFRANEKPEALPPEGPGLSEVEGETVVPSVLRGQAPAPARRRVCADFRSYWSRCWEEFEAAAGMMDPESYASPARAGG